MIHAEVASYESLDDKSEHGDNAADEEFCKVHLGYLCIRTLPTHTDEMVTEVLKGDSLEWANSSTAKDQANPMICLGSAGTIPFFLPLRTIKIILGAFGQVPIVPRDPMPPSAFVISVCPLGDGRFGSRISTSTL